MINAQEQLVGWSVPPGIAFARRELQNFQRMPVGVFEVKGLNAAGIGIPIR
jgi:hypothetical protein